jgi:hypothetical protein
VGINFDARRSMQTGSNDKRALTFLSECLTLPNTTHLTSAYIKGYKIKF